MGDFGQELVGLLTYLLPGFLAAWVYYGLTSFALPSQFERVIQALIFTLLVQPLVFAAKFLLTGLGDYWSLLPWSDKAELTTSVACGFLLGTLFAVYANNDAFHRLMRRLGITREKSYPSHWYGAFCENVTDVVLHLADTNRICGWPKEWPSEPDKDYFVLEEACWLAEDNTEIPLSKGTRVLIPASQVRLVEFMDLDWRSDNGNESKRIKPAAAPRENQAAPFAPST